MFELISGIYETFLYQPIYNLVVFLSVFSPDQNLGWAVIVLALIVRILFLPFTLGGFKTDNLLAETAPILKQIEDDNSLDSRQKRQKISAFLKSKGINPLSEIFSLFGQIIFLAILYQIVQDGLHPPYTDLYGFVPKPNDIQTNFYGVDISKAGNLIYSAGAAGILFIEQLWEYEDKKDIPEATFSGRWYPLLLPTATFILLMLLPATKALFLAVSVLFSLGIRLMVTLARSSKKQKEH